MLLFFVFVLIRIANFKKIFLIYEFRDKRIFFFYKTISTFYELESSFI